MNGIRGNRPNVLFTGPDFIGPVEIVKNHRIVGSIELFEATTNVHSNVLKLLTRQSRWMVSCVLQPV